MIEENINSLKECVRALVKQNKKVETFPFVLQYDDTWFGKTWHNPSEIEPLSIPVLQKYLNPLGWPFIETINFEGVKIMETYNVLLRKLEKHYTFSCDRRTSS